MIIIVIEYQTKKQELTFIIDRFIRAIFIHYRY